MDADAVAARLIPSAGAIFLLAGLLVALAGWRGGPVMYHRLWTAYLTEFVIIGAVVVPAYFGTAALFLAVGCICAVATAELLRVMRGPVPSPLVGLGLLGSVTVVGAAAIGGEALALRTLVVAACVALAAGLTTRPGSAPGAHPAALTLVSLVYPSAFGAYLLLLGRSDDGFGLVAFLVGIIELNDSAAMLAGILVGGPKLWPRLSPNKTVAGSCAGLLASAGGAAALEFAVPGLTMPQALGAGLLVGFGGQAGDLVASAIKRAAGVKDFAAFIPGQGGILDVYDALLFTAPLFWLYLKAMQPG